MNGAQLRALTARHVASGSATIVWTPAGGWADTPEGAREAERETHRIRREYSKAARA